MKFGSINYCNWELGPLFLVVVNHHIEHLITVHTKRLVDREVSPDPGNASSALHVLGDVSSPLIQHRVDTILCTSGDLTNTNKIQVRQKLRFGIATGCLILVVLRMSILVLEIPAACLTMNYVVLKITTIVFLDSQYNTNQSLASTQSLTQSFAYFCAKYSLKRGGEILMMKLHSGQFILALVLPSNLLSFKAHF